MEHAIITFVMIDFSFGPTNFDTQSLGFGAGLRPPQYSEQFNHRVNDVPVSFYPRNYLQPRYSRTGIITNKFDQISSVSRVLHTTRG